MTPPRLGDEDVTPNLTGGVGHDTKQAIKVIADRLTTGEWDAVPTSEHRNMYVDLKRKHDRAKIASYVGPIVAAASVGLAVWLGDAVWSKAKDQVTADVSAELKTTTQRNDDAHAALTSEIGSIKTEVTTMKGEQAKTTALLKRVARKLKVDE